MKKFHVVGVMSGTSLDGIDFAEIIFTKNKNWSFQLQKCDTYAYPAQWVKKLSLASTLNEPSLKDLNKEYTQYLSEQIRRFVIENNIKDIDAICSHGHTVLHDPDNGETLQIGNLSTISSLVNETVVCNFRVADVVLGGQGAPLVPIGDRLLFSEYDYCLNLGGFSNISFEKGNKRIAYDICAVNVVLNHYANKLGLAYDDGGKIARSGKLNKYLLDDLNGLEFYKENHPKSLGIEWVNAKVFPLIKKYDVSVTDILYTYINHIATIMANEITGPANKKILITGGGAFNTFLIECFQNKIETKVVIPSKQLVEFKEALIFGLLGVLKLENEINVLHSVTGAKKDHSSGVIYYK